MELAKIEVSRADARKVHCDTLTAGMKGAEVSFSFDASWAGLKRIATFKAGSTSRDVLLTEDHCQIPHEVLAKPCPRLVVGIVGAASDDSVVIPTVWAELGRVEQGAKPSGDSSTKPTPEVWAQILGMIGDLNELNTEEKETLVAAINEVLFKGADPEEVERIVSEYLAENGIGGGIHIGPYPPDDPNVDIWLDTSEEETPPYIPNTTMAKPGQIVRVVTVDENGAIVAVEAVDMPGGGEYELSAATADTLGGIKAEPVTENDTQPVRIGEDGMLYTAPGGIPGAGNARETTVLAELALTEDVDGTIRIPLIANPFAYSALLIEIRSQRMTDGRTQYTGQLYGGGKHSQIFHLNTVFDASSVKTVYVMTHLFHDAVHSIAAKKGDYMWNTTNHYTDVYPIETQADAKECVLEIENCSAVSGATFKVQGVK